SEDQIFDAELSIEGYSDVPGVQTELIEDAGHAPQVEKPEEVAELIDGFTLKAEPRAGGAKKAKKAKARKNKSDRKGKRRGRRK
ncbi:MAG: alpha/beta hydrolase, partial [Actinomycetota bacterium]|nr:alpha/beta hydrolase [Actinomycetota bacterium]